MSSELNWAVGACLVRGAIRLDRCTGAVDIGVRVETALLASSKIRSAGEIVCVCVSSVLSLLVGGVGGMSEGLPKDECERGGLSGKASRFDAVNCSGT